MYSDSDFGRSGGDPGSIRGGSGGDPGPPLPALLKWELAPFLGWIFDSVLGDFWAAFLPLFFGPIITRRSRYHWRRSMAP